MLRVGSTVQYRLSEADAKVVNGRRAKGGRDKVEGRVAAGDPAAMIVTSWVLASETASGHVLTDGSDIIWVASALPGDGPGEFTE